jgi:L-fuconolactonase
MIIDTHVHVWVEHSDQYPHQRLTPPPATPVELLLENMDKVGITHAVLVQPSLYGADNAYLADCLLRYPGRFAGIGMVDVRSPDAVKQLSYWVNERGIRGVRLMPLSDPQDDFLLQPGVRQICEQSAKLSIPVSILLAPRHIPILKVLISECPDTKVIIEHIGRPDVVEKPLEEAIQPLLELAPYPYVYIKVSAISYISRDKKYPFTDTFSMIRKVKEHFGSKRMMWASDFPGVLGRGGYAEELAIVRDWIPFLDQGEREWIMNGTAQTLWNFS